LSNAIGSDDSVAAVVARFLKARGVKRLFALCGGHIMPIMMQADRRGIEIVDVRDERCAVHMAQAHAELTGELGVALVTAGPGVTNAITGIANANVARAPVLVISGVSTRQQENRGCIQDMSHVEIVHAITRYARTVREPSLVLQELDEAVARALGESGEPGPAFIDFPLDVLRAPVPRPLQLPEHFAAKPRRSWHPDPGAVVEAVQLLWQAKRPLVIAGRGARDAAPELLRLLDRLGAAYLDTGESRGLVPDSNAAVVAAMRSVAMREADVVVTIGRRLDFQLAYGSPAIFKQAKFVRIADIGSELRDNRRGEAEIFAPPATALAAILELAGDREPATDPGWASNLRAKHLERLAKAFKTMQESPAGTDGRMHPNRLLTTLQGHLTDDAILVCDGGDALSFARVALSASTYLDCGSFGCLGIGLPYGIAAGLAYPERQVVVVTGDGSFGFNAMEIDTAVRHKAPLLIVILNNGAWQIEVHDQKENYHRVVGTQLQFSNYAAMARAFGMYAERVERAEDLDAAIQRALAAGTALLDVVVTPEAVSSDAKLGLAFGFDLQILRTWDEEERAWRNEESEN